MSYKIGLVELPEDTRIIADRTRIRIEITAARDKLKEIKNSKEFKELQQRPFSQRALVKIHNDNKLLHEVTLVRASINPQLYPWRGKSLVVIEGELIE